MMFWQRLTESIETSASWQRLCEAVATSVTSQQVVVCDGLWGSAANLVAGKLSQKHSAILLVVTDSDQLDAAANDLEFFAAQDMFSSSVASFPPLQSLETSLEERYTVGDHLFGERLALLKQLSENSGDSDVIIVTTLPALMQPVPTLQQLRDATQLLRVGGSIAIDALVEWLLEAGWHAMPAVDLPGEVARRGHIVDLFAPDWEYPVRVEFFGDEIESIRRFDIPTQRSIEQLKSITLTRISEAAVTTATTIASLFDYLPPRILPILIDSEAVVSSGDQYRQRVDAARSLHTVRETMAKLMSLSLPLVTMATCATGSPVTTWDVGSTERLSGSLATVQTALESLSNTTTDVTIVAPTDAEAARLTELFSQLTIAQQGRLHTAVGAFRGGFHWRVSDQIVIGTPQLFGHREVRRIKRRHLGQAIDSFLDLQSGDLVVHLSHGIGRYRGIQTITKERQEEDHLVVEFADEALIYVPVSKIGLVQKYVGGRKASPPLAKLGAAQWQRQKKAVQAAVFDMAAEMLELQATRATRDGVAFPEDTAWQEQFDAAFPYRETDDQIVAIAAIKADMTTPRPMDRLLCGDVGFGKTEVALRAAFKAIDAGYQAAILVPTTVLAEQHTRTCRERFAEFPVTIATLSRFQSPKEQTNIIEGLATGAVDLVIGTHRLTSKDVVFCKLGLLVIDEEQRFGVAAKERLKELRSTVDILTMTATPIPRTLHLSLLGIRDISNLESPPEDRLAVETRLLRFDDAIIRSAILRELDRGGQIFFVHNRVKDIEQIASRLQRIVPEARIGIGHAQMPDGDLEKVMRAFVLHEFDMLVSTTIVESGLDIPNANTIFIDEADHYGLAELHQLRGRVGRDRHQAYCYLLLDVTQELRDVAAKRLRAIEEFSYLGAGFQLAMRDLEIRGAGNILGTQQSGHIATVGYELYCQLLESAVRVLKKMPQKPRIEMELDLPGRALLPRDYVTNQRMRIDLYRRLARVTTLDEMEILREEIVDRFGKIPPDAARLLQHSEIRVRGAKWTIRTVRLERQIAGDTAALRGGGYVVFDYTSRREMESLQKKLRPLSLRITDEGKAYLPFPPEIGGISGTPDAIIEFIIDVLTAY